MGQAFRRASGRIRNSASDPSPSSHLKNSTGLRQPVVPGDKVEISKNLGKGNNVTAGKAFSSNPQHFAFAPFGCCVSVCNRGRI